MAARTTSSIARLTLAGRLRRGAPAAGQALGAAVACALWLGLASPGLQLLPGLDGLADESIAISLQSAVLGIDDGSGRPAEERAREAAAVLGLTYADELLSPEAIEAAVAAGPEAASAAVVRLGAVFAGGGGGATLPRTEREGDPSSPSTVAEPVSVLIPSSEPASAPPAPAAPASREQPAAAAPVAPPAPAAPPPAALVQQTIEFTTRSAQSVVGGVYYVAATASSGLPVKFTASGGTGVCKIAGSVVSFRESGTCVVEARQGGSAKYREASAQQSIAVSRAGQTISFQSAPPATAVADGPAYTVVATASSGLPVSLSTPSSNVCRVSGSTVSLVGAGTCTVEADQAGDERYAPAPRAQQAFAVLKAVAGLSGQSISFTSSAPPAVVGGPVYSVAASASSGLPVTFAASAGSAGVCAVSGSAVSFLGEGTCVIEAHQAGNAGLAAAVAYQSFQVDLAPQAVSFISTPPATAVAGSTEYTVSASATSGLPVLFSVAQSSAAICAVSGTTVTAIDAGTCIVEANQPGDATFAAAPQIQQSFIVGSPAPSLSDQTIAYTSTPPASATAGGPAYAVTAAASSGLPVTFAAAPSSAGVCSVSGSTVSFAGPGTCTITADQSGSASYNPAPQAQQSFAVGRASQAISFASTPPVPAAVGDPDYTVVANASSGLAVTFAAAPSSAGICTVSGSNVSLVGSGTCTIVASQAGNAVYDPAAPVQQAFTVGAGAPTLSPQTIAFTSTAPSPALVGGTAYTVVAGASSGLPVVFTAAPASAGICSVSGSTVSFAGAGTCTIDANQSGSASYEPAPQVQQSFSVATPPPAAQTIGFTSSAPASAVYGGPSYTVSATATSGLAVSFSAAPSSSGVCAVSGSSVSIVGAGTCTVRANQAGNASWQAAPQVRQTFTVARASQTIAITSTPPPVDKRSPPYTITATSTSGLPVTFSIAASSTDNCSISGATITFKKQGDCVVNANQAGNANYLPAPQVQQVIDVQPKV